MTVLFTDIVGSTERAVDLGDRAWRRLLDAHDEAMRIEFAKHGGREIKATGDGFVATFAAPADAIHAALAAIESLADLDLQITAGVHCGECETRGEDLVGVGVHIAARVGALAQPNEVLVSSTVRDLTAGAGFIYTPRGAHALKGVPGRWRTYAATIASTGTIAATGSRKGKPRNKPAAAPAPTTDRSLATAPIRIVVVDDHPLWRQTLKTVVERTRSATVIAEAGDGNEAITVLAAARPDVVVMDMDLPALHGIEATRRIVANDPAVKVLVLSSSDESDQVVAAVRAGAAGYLLKTAKPADIVGAVQRIHAGELVFPPALASVVLAELRGQRTDRVTAGPSVTVVGGSTIDEQAVAALLGSAGISVVETGADVTIVILNGQPARALPSGPVLALAAEIDLRVAMELLGERSTAVGYLLKDRVRDVEQLATAIQRVSAGESVIDPDVVAALVRGDRGRSSVADLTAKERAVLALMAEGRSNLAIADQLHMGQKTVESHVSSIFSKLGLEPAGDDHRRVLAVLAFLRSG